MKIIQFIPLAISAFKTEKRRKMNGLFNDFRVI